MTPKENVDDHGSTGFPVGDIPRVGASFAAPHGSDEDELRRMLAWAYSGHHLYCDDGEMQDNREHPFIDFRRDTIAER